MRLKYLEDWPDCNVPGCDKKICLALASPFCFPHTPGTDEEKHAKIDTLHGIPPAPPNP